MNKKKLATIAASSMLSVGLLVGGASYALFTSTAANSNNNFKAGTLTLSTHRQDVPIEGPMFYVNDSDGGRMGTGIWAPLDSHSRAMLIKNTGTLDGKLTKIYAEVESGAKAQAFAEQALATVAVFQTNGVTLDATAVDNLNRALDANFKDLMSHWYSQWAGRSLQEVEAGIREAALDWTFDVNNNGQSVRVGISDLYVGPLKDLLNANGVAAVPNVKVQSGKTMHLGFTVTLLDDNGQTFDNNDIKDVTAQFKFKTLFEQVRNN